MKTPVIRFGGKTVLTPWLLELLRTLAPHLCYCEPFCGGAALFFAKPPSEVEILNDKDKIIYDFYAILRDPQLAERLQQKLKYTLWSRLELETCRKTWRQTEDIVERVWAWFVVLRQSFTHETDEKAAWLCSKKENQAKRFARAVDTLQFCAQRLRDAQIENRSFEHVIKLYDMPEMFFYCDPPYMKETRVDGGYDDGLEMSTEQHELLLDLLNSAKAQVVLSGYPSDFYAQRLPSSRWHYYEKTRKAHIRNSRQHKISYRTECVWIKTHTTHLFSLNGLSEKSFPKAEE
jgi:DNA adenine methylase